MANLRTKILHFGGLYSSVVSNLRGGILMSVGSLPESLSQGLLVGILLVGRLRARPPPQRSSGDGASGVGDLLPRASRLQKKTLTRGWAKNFEHAKSYRGERLYGLLHETEYNLGAESPAKVWLAKIRGEDRLRLRSPKDVRWRDRPRGNLLYLDPLRPYIHTTLV